MKEFFALLGIFLVSNLIVASEPVKTINEEAVIIISSDEDEVTQIIASYYSISISDVDVTILGNSGTATADISGSPLLSSYESSVINLTVEIKTINGVRIARIYYKSSFIVEDDIDGL